MNNALFEIGVEELPARFIDDAEAQLKAKTLKWLTTSRIEFEAVITYSTPRRLAVLIKGIAEKQLTIDEEVRGPQIKIAKDADDNWTKAAIGFTKGQNKSTDDIYIKEIKGTSYIFVNNHIEGKPTIELLPDFKVIIEAIQFSQTMRWGSGAFRFARPIRWLVALYNAEVIPFEIANVKTNNVTRGHRFLGNETVISNPVDYEAQLQKEFVIVDPVVRENLIKDQMKELEKVAGFSIIIAEALLQEVRNLVEYPTVFYGSFDKDYLQLPKEVLITSMEEHQRYFPVVSETGELLPYFIGVRNGDDHELANVVSGNEKVLRARLADGVFFYEEDQKNSIDFYLEKLKTVVFQKEIGTVHEKLTKIKQITQLINDKLKLDHKTSKQAIRTAKICKFDLMTNMINEFPELQGIMGEYYALNKGEDPVVAQAIKEHYYPLQANGKLASSIPGAVVSIADKIDTIVGTISVGLIPTGSQDPYGLRRQAIGVLRTMEEHQWNLTIEEIIQVTENLYDISDKQVIEKIEEFFTSRAAYLLGKKGIEQDIVKAVLHDDIGIYHYSVAKAELLSEKRNDDSFKTTQEALVRVMNLGKKHLQTEINEKLFTTDTEKDLYKQYKLIKDNFMTAHNEYNAKESLNELSKLAEPIHKFFEDTMVMDKDESIKNNRLALVHQISELISVFADLSLIEWKQSGA